MVDQTQLILDLQKACGRICCDSKHDAKAVQDDEYGRYVSRHLLRYNPDDISCHTIHLMLGTAAHYWSREVEESASERLVRLFAFEDSEFETDKLFQSIIRDDLSVFIKSEAVLVLQWLLWRGEALPEIIWIETWRLAIRNWTDYAQTTKSGNLNAGNRH